MDLHRHLCFSSTHAFLEATRSIVSKNRKANVVSKQMHGVQLTEQSFKQSCRRSLAHALCLKSSLQGSLLGGLQTQTRCMQLEGFCRSWKLQGLLTQSSSLWLSFVAQTNRVSVRL
jgi:hypothetical protein